MSDTEHKPRRETLTGITPDALLDRLPDMGRLMVIGRHDGVTHERIGPVEQVQTREGAVCLSGQCHDARIRTGNVASIVLDTGSVMGGKVFPRLEFMTADGGTAFSIVGMEGEGPFEMPLSDISRQPLAATDARNASGQDKPEFDPADPACPPFDLAVNAGAQVEILFDNGTLCQSWQGRIDAVKPAMGFLNVMTPDFHLHLKGGTLAGWQAATHSRKGLHHDGAITALELKSECFQ
ncbi:hypothetical protein PAF17_09135 [Paracoccus sp. Z330]|uniref:Haemin-degrading HemS/ChuX domain-containing protein n=1 Tax=Paracoccus onchidii TaxID=3017813 RepID=A0ABT4ZG36_9RHOB|nr:ChuX/HutX family heme-like substrate-binding protein [Paracoccus onchidii]MDB6177676.1 hypothetical protein [Paracoccus onchidii]